MQSNESTISTPAKIKNFFLDLVFPPVCLGCNSLIDSNQYQNRNYRPGMCDKCRSTIVLQSSFACAFCQAGVVNGITCPFCRRDHELRQLLVATSYEQPLVKSAIKNFKYKFMQGLANDLGSVMSTYLQKQIERGVINLNNVVVVPVPLSAQRLRWRGFNQAELLAKHLAETFNLELVPALERTRNHKSQVEIVNRQDRINNMSDGFVCTSALVADRDILLIDDISTTGATLEACAQALKKSGASKITGFVFARN